MKNNTYMGRRTSPGQCIVTVSEDGATARLLLPRFDLRNHSPDGFEFGYAGSGPSQLALAILANELGDDEALKLYQDFTREMIAKIETDKFKITSEVINAWLTVRNMPKTREEYSEISGDATALPVAVKHLIDAFGDNSKHGFLFATTNDHIDVVSFHRCQSFPLAAAKRMHAALGEAIAMLEKQQAGGKTP